MGKKHRERPGYSIGGPVTEDLWEAIASQRAGGTGNQLNSGQEDDAKASDPTGVDTSTAVQPQSSQVSVRTQRVAPIAHLQQPPAKHEKHYKKPLALRPTAPNTAPNNLTGKFLRNAVALMSMASGINESLRVCVVDALERNPEMNGLVHSSQTFADDFTAALQRGVLASASRKFITSRGEEQNPYGDLIQQTEDDQFELTQSATQAINRTAKALCTRFRAQTSDKTR